MSGYTLTEKENFKRTGFHNYKEFIEHLNDLLVERYGPEHNILFKKELCKYRQSKYKRILDNHVITFDVTYSCEKAKFLGEYRYNNVFSSDGRGMWNEFLISCDIEEAILDN